MFGSSGSPPPAPQATTENNNGFFSYSPFRAVHIKRPFNVTHFFHIRHPNSFPHFSAVVHLTSRSHAIIYAFHSRRAARLYIYLVIVQIKRSFISATLYPPSLQRYRTDYNSITLPPEGYSSTLQRYDKKAVSAIATAK